MPPLGYRRHPAAPLDPENRKVQPGTSAGRGYLPARREERPPPPPPKECRWIEGDAKAVHVLGDAIFCGGATVPGSSYCAEHHARCWRKGGEVPTTEKEVRAAHWVVGKRRAA